MDVLESLVRLNLSGMVGSSLLRRLLAQFELPRIHRLSRRELERVPGIGPLPSKAIVEAGDPAREIDLAARHGIGILPVSGADYPPALRTLYDHPIVLYRRGATVDADALAIGIVGSRECTDYGRRQAARFGQELARLRVSVVSGLARGIDTAAHRGALKAPEGRTIAFLGSGLLRVYPPENARLLDEICARGAAFSEFPLEAPPETTNFPRRNRLISGLSLGVLVVEAAERSGALITADWALEQGRDVFCLPGSIESPLSRGCHRLIKQGAKLVEEPSDLLEEIPAFASLVEPAVALTPLERAVARRLSERSSNVESIAAATRLPASCVERALGELVSKGAALQDGPDLYRGR
ncbi:MAG: DNA-protecting protein DprA [Planctomycetes bacterium]|nr:DNA-protecting protein DprA [Planctomycetota bacterium]